MNNKRIFHSPSRSAGRLAAMLTIAAFLAAGCEPEIQNATPESELTGGPVPLKEARQLADRCVRDFDAKTPKAEKKRKTAETPQIDDNSEMRRTFREMVIRLLAHHDPAARAEAAQALGELRKLQAVDALLLAAEDDNRAVRVSAIEALGWIGDPTAAPAIAPRLNDSAVDVRAAAATALGRLKNPLAAEALVEALSDADARVRSAAARSLGWVRYHKACAKLIAALNDPAPQVRASAAGALGLLAQPVPGDPKAQPMNPKQAVAPLINALSDKHPLVRYQAACTLGQLGDKRAIEHLEPLTKDIDPAVGKAATAAIQNLRGVK